ncbi:bluetail domain-containing putative surface protein [Halovibrio sp. HP20-50]|uniref:beta strand repeat-containing protein n=1 Tax=Halovibrio sp. HP20-59 TaxID=3080275 RepID=UPI00294B5436|nr:bluetail domain-containing putative surface protein [Halovibrio sp. HP20-59]MEA2120076.1 bluetail domain-containing putative surface protein [Halovibrio sp. HP20-59]
MNATYKNGTDFGFTPTIRNVENINVNIDSLAGTDNTFNALNVRGATITLASTKLGFDGEAGASEVAANNVTAGQNVTDLTVADLTTGVVDTGAAEVASVTTANGTDVANITSNGDIDLTIGTATDAVLTTTADAEVNLTADDTTTLTVAGEGDVTLLAGDLTTDEIVNNKASGTLTASVAADANVGDWNVDNIQVTADAALTGVALAPIELTEEALTVSAAGKAAATSNVVINTAVDQTSITATQAKTATVNLTAAAVVTTLDVGAIDTTINVAEASEIATLTSTGEVTLAGEGDVEIGGTAATEAAVIDAAGLAGKLTVETAANDASVVAGAGGLELTTGAETDTVAVTGNTGADVVDASSITTGTIVFEGGAGEDQLTVDVATAAAATVVFDGGEGNDKLVLANATDLTSATVTLANVETIDVDGASATVKAATLSGQSFAITGDGFNASVLNIAGTAAADTIDLSGLTASSSVGGTGVSLKVTGGASNDMITLGSATETVVVGARDTAGLDTITNFSANDFLSFNDATSVVNLVSGADAVTFTKGTGTGQFADLDAVLDTFATSGDNELVVNTAAVFTFDSKSYALIDGETAGYAAADDAIVELVGTDVTTLGAGNFIAA